VDSGKGRLLLTYTENRLKRYPNVPTAKELGHNIVIRSPWGIAGPKGMDPKTVQVLHDAFRKAMNDPAFIRSVEINGQPLTYMSSKDYAKFAEEQTLEDKKFITELDIKLE
jgi:tripartite-type tricarboxylate transporter receptor subunit TctC